MADRRKLSVRSSPDRPAVAMCAGKDCRKRCEFAKVRSALDRECAVIDLKCIGLCSGPVVVTDIDTGSPKVYAKLRSKKDRRLVIDAASGRASASADLSPRKVSKKKAATSVSRQLRRHAA